jgi:DNA sulfur modification protein DndB
VEKILKNITRKRVGSRTFYYGSFDSDEAKELTFVPVIEKSVKTPLNEDDADGYQRPGSISRMRRFTNFLKDNPTSLVPPVILSARGRWLFEPSSFDDNIGTIRITGRAAIIDGQHRLGGYVLHQEEVGSSLSIDFVVIDNLTHHDEELEFVVINNSQVGVPRSLTTFLAADNPLLPARVDSDYVRIAWALDQDSSSPFFSRITRTKLGPTSLFALHSVSQYVEKMFSHGALVDLDKETKTSIAIKYWNLIQDAHPEQFADMDKLGVPKEGRKSFEFKLLELTGFVAWSLIAPVILSEAFNYAEQEMDWEKVQEQINYLSDKIDWRKHGKYKNATGVVGGPQIKLDMERALQLR